MEYWSVIFRLEKVGDLRRTEREIDDQINLCRLKALPGSPVLSDMPKTHTNAVHGLDDFYVDAEKFFKAKKRIEIQINAERTGKTVRCISMLILRGTRRIAENYDLVA